MDWLLLRDLLNARLYPHKVKTVRGRLNTKQIFYVVSYIGFMIFACNMMLAPVSAKKNDVTITPDTSDFLATAWAPYTQTAVAFPTSTVTSTAIPAFTDTPVPTVTLSPAPTSSVSYNTNKFSTQVFSLSFYDPHIGVYFPDKASINCLEFDFSLGDCVSKVHHGQDDYHEWIGKGAACPASLPYDAVFLVSFPVELSGVWRCIDVGDLDRNGLHYIDFMLSYPSMIWTGPNLDDFPWSSDVLIEVLSVP